MNTNKMTSYVTLARKPCCGSCPAYTITLDSNGRVIFHQDNKKDLIQIVPPSIVYSIFSKINKNPFWNLFSTAYNQSKCHNKTDFPSATLFVKEPFRNHQVEHSYGCNKNPKSLIELEDYIDEKLNVKKLLGKQQITLFPRGSTEWINGEPQVTIYV